MKKIISILLTIIMISGISLQAFAFDTDKVNDLTINVGKYLCETVENPVVSSVGGEWTILGLARSDMDIPKEYFENYYQNVTKHLRECDGVLHNKKYTEYSRVILALTAIGKNPTDIAGYNLLKPLADYEKTVFQGVNGSIWALIALDSGNYDIPINTDAKIQATREMYVNHILNSQTSDGGWALSGDIADADVTGMALQALSKYKDDARAKAAIQKALLCLSVMQKENGGFSSYEAENSESNVQVIVALCELGISVYDDRFIKDGNTIVDNLLAFYDGKKGFKHIHTDDTNQMATEQCFYALVALKRASDNKNSLYDMSDVSYDDSFINTEFIDKKTDILYQNKTFSDIENHRDKAAIEALASRGIINGKSENSFEPNSTMTRAEFATIVVRGLGLEHNGIVIFDDVNHSDWFYDYVATAYKYGIIKGISENEFNPYGTITREEASVMITRAAKICGIDTQMDTMAVRDVLAQFPDYVKAAEWSQSSLAFCYDNEILDDSVMDIKPKEAVLRAEIASMLFAMLNLAKML